MRCQGVVPNNALIWCIALFALVVGAAACDIISGKPRLTPLQREFQSLPTDLVPLFVIGDVNEDGKIDPLDQTIVSRVVSSGGKDLREVSCLAAADVTLDGVIDENDVTALRELSSRGGDIVAFPLYAQPYLQCNHRNRVLAAPVEWMSGQPVLVRLLQDRTTDQVKLSLEGPGEPQTLADRSGWDIRLPGDLDTAALITLKVSLGEVSFIYTLANFSRLEKEAKDAAFTEAWVEASLTDLDGDGNVDDPRDMPLPTAWGEEIASVARCPQEGNGCEALIIDFAKRILFAYDADRTKGALEGVGCNVSYVAPAFVTIPRPYWIMRASGSLVLHRPDQASIDRAEATNRAAWLEIREAISRHRANVSAGKDLVIQLVRGHGNDAARYGTWGPGFSTGGGDLTRQDFHHGNYLVTRGKACNAIAVDWSCYSENTPKAIERLNNTGRAHYYYWETSPSINHGFHAAFWGDMAAAASSSTETCTNGDAGNLDASMKEMIQSYGQNGDFSRLAAHGFRPLVLDGAGGKYSDRGYNRRSGTQCEAASHAHSY